MYKKILYKQIILVFYLVNGLGGMHFGFASAARLSAKGQTNLNLF